MEEAVANAEGHFCFCFGSLFTTQFWCKLVFNPVYLFRRVFIFRPTGAMALWYSGGVLTQKL